MAETINTIVVGAGQAGLATSYFLKRHDVEHLVLEQSEVAASWRQRWDSFTLVTPNGMCGLPGFPWDGDPGGYLGRDEVISYLADFAASFEPPLRTGVRVAAARPAGGGFRVETSAGAYSCRNLVVATGLFQRPALPACAGRLDPQVPQLHSSAYRGPGQLPAGAVLVVGSGQSGAQIADELHGAGRQVYLSVSRAGRAPRRYRGRDVMDWMRELGVFDMGVDQLESPAERFEAHAHLSGRDGGRTLNLRRFGRAGMVLLGKVSDAEGDRVRLAPDLEQNLGAADEAAARLCTMLDRRIAEAGIHAPPPDDDELQPERWSPPAGPGELGLRDAGIGAVIWATGYCFDFSWIAGLAVDPFGYPVQRQGVTPTPGLFFVGLHWLNKFKSGLLYGVAEDAEHVAGQVAARQAEVSRV
ncbi:MAG TPA: NAD(P)/FAD-dependent oxidoreductase [Chloroflexaceae bacterium]|nr:NAD(P)/FAD-dependent oxidoreductase [Chloroflexaceae bacterium]